MLNKLNGWQRLWVLFIVLAGALGAFVIIMDYPSSEDAEITLRETIAALENNAEADGPWTKWQQDPIVDESAFGDPLIPEESESQKVKPRFSGVPVDPQPSIAQRKQEAQQQYEKELKRISRDRRNLVTQVVTVWLGWSIGFYALGWMIAWVIRGFRKPQA